MSLNPRAERDHDDGEVGWDGDKHYTDRLRFDFEFHSKTGDNLINQYVEEMNELIK